jgi:hypothetical protein
MIPTIMRLERKDAICVTPAPLDRSAAAAGKATKPGIKVMPRRGRRPDAQKPYPRR